MPIALSRAEWARILKWTDENKEDPDAVRRREYVRKLNAASQQMTKSWPNSVENVNKRNEELRLGRVAAAERANAQFYRRYVQRHKDTQRRLMYSARDTVFKNKDAPKLLLSAVIESVVQKERIEQRKFNAERRQAEAERKRQDDDDVIRKAKEWNELMELKKKRRYEANKAHQKEILDQAEEISERNRKEHEYELELQQLDNQKATEQINAIKDFETQFKAAEKARIWSDMERSRQESRARRGEQAARRRADDRLVAVLDHSRARIERKRRQTEADIKEEKLRVLEAISQKLESGDAAREAEEQAMLDKAIKEKNAIDEARRVAQKNKEDQIRQQRVEDRQQYLRDEAQRLQDLNTIRQWEIMNRFKNQELYDEFQEKLKLEKERKVQNYRADIIKLWQERIDTEARELSETRYFYGALAEQKLRDADNKLLTHAASLLHEARLHGRPDHALHKAIDRYCKLYRLYPMPDLPPSLQEHFTRYAPWDGSKADVGYTEPPPPPPADTQSPSPPQGKRDGMQDDAKAGPSQVPTAREEPQQDYKRAGRADGLQRKREEFDLTLPPITVIPCKTADCTCDLKRK